MVHANWSGGGLHVWGELPPNGERTETDDGAHPWTTPPESLRDLMTTLGVSLPGGEEGTLEVRLPAAGGSPLPSPKLAHWSGHEAHDDALAGAVLETWRVRAVRISPADAPRVLSELEELGQRTEDLLFEESSGHEQERPVHAVAGESIRFYATAARFGQALLAEQRFVPTIIQGRDGPLLGAWEPWLHDENIAERTSLLLAGMPPIARAVADEHQHDAASVLHAFLCGIVDALSRRALRSEQMEEAIEDWDSGEDPHVGWLAGLLGEDTVVRAPVRARTDIVRSVRTWLGGLEERGGETPWRLALRLNEPLEPGGIPDFAAGEDLFWVLSFHLQSLENEKLIVDAEDVWALRGDTASVDGHRIDAPQELLLGELGRASRLYKPLESALEEAAPTELMLPTSKAYQFLREIGPILSEQGFGVIVPEWWDSPSARLGARLMLSERTAPEEGPGMGASPSAAGEARLGLNALVSYQWRLAVGDNPLTLEEFERIAASRAPLVHIDGQWVEIRREDIDQALKFIRENPGGEMRVGDALRMAYAADITGAGVQVLGVDADGWIADLMGDGSKVGYQQLEPPEGFHGTLRPYQIKGLSWLAFLDRIGLGPCLADDMGLGKTIQLLALLVHERTEARKVAGITNGDARPASEYGIDPTLIVVPMSIVGNWVREINRFAPELRVLVHHGVDRLTGDDFFREAQRSDVIITTYALANRDRDMLECISWGRVVLDEAQNIKNPQAKQSQAVRAFDTTRRVALTGTPLENRLSELWSIIDFCNPGFLGTSGEFRRTFSIPIERHRDRHRAAQLRQLVRPFILRRLKTDPAVISDLPEKLETKEFCRLTSEQAQLYETCVKSMLGEVERSEGIRRRGVVLTTLIRLKQICNHPGLVTREDAPKKDDPGAGDAAAVGAGPGEPTRSGKCIRLLEMLDEVIASDEQALVFTQFRQMGHLLAGMLRHAFDREVLFLHGGTPQKQREAMVDRFQKGDGSAPIFILSLKAGGVGLNLTAASHVFHFDRWWNPAVENQATDRAFRIGQTKTVNVHKFVVSGSLEERIDQMIESKIALAEDVIGSGEDWLTELDVTELQDILRLRPDAFADADD